MQHLLCCLMLPMQSSFMMQLMMWPFCCCSKKVTRLTQSIAKFMRWRFWKTKCYTDWSSLVPTFHPLLFSKPGFARIGFTLWSAAIRKFNWGNRCGLISLLTTVFSLYLSLCFSKHGRIPGIVGSSAGSSWDLHNNGDHLQTSADHQRAIIIKQLLLCCCNEANTLC